MLRPIVISIFAIFSSFSSQKAVDGTCPPYLRQPKLSFPTELTCKKDECNTCCPQDSFCCSDGICMERDPLCRYPDSCATLGACCAQMGGVECGQLCASAPYSCCNSSSSQVCRRPETCCGPGCCSSDRFCCGETCCPNGSICCGGSCYPAGYVCCDRSRGVACRSTDGQCCGGECCPKGVPCCDGICCHQPITLSRCCNKSCCPENQFCCWGICCSSKQYCCLNHKETWTCSDVKEGFCVRPDKTQMLMAISNVTGSAVQPLNFNFQPKASNFNDEPKQIVPASFQCWESRSNESDFCDAIACVRNMTACPTSKDLEMLGTVFCQGINELRELFQPDAVRFLSCLRRQLTAIYTTPFKENARLPCCDSLSRWGAEQWKSAFRECGFCAVFLDNEGAFDKLLSLGQFDADSLFFIYCTGYAT